MLLGLALLYVGAVLFLNGLWLMGKIGDNEISIINIFSGLITFLIAMYLAFGPGADAGSIKAAGLTLLFTFTFSGSPSTAIAVPMVVGLAGSVCSSQSPSCQLRLTHWPQPPPPGMFGLDFAGLPGRFFGSCTFCCWRRKSRSPRSPAW